MTMGIKTDRRYGGIGRRTAKIVRLTPLSESYGA